MLDTYVQKHFEKARNNGHDLLFLVKLLVPGFRSVGIPIRMRIQERQIDADPDPQHGFNLL
jgi:hypothetical protein